MSLCVCRRSGVSAQHAPATRSSGRGPPGRCVAQSRDFLGAPPCPLSSACLGRRRAVTLCSRKHNWKLPAEPTRPDTSPKSVVNLGAAAPETPQLFPDSAVPRTAVFRRHRTERLCRRHTVSRADGPHLPPATQPDAQQRQPACTSPLTHQIPATMCHLFEFFSSAWRTTIPLGSYYHSARSAQRQTTEGKLQTVPSHERALRGLGVAASAVWARPMFDCTSSAADMFGIRRHIHTQNSINISKCKKCFTF